MLRLAQKNLAKDFKPHKHLSRGQRGYDEFEQQFQAQPKNPVWDSHDRNKYKKNISPGSKLAYQRFQYQIKRHHVDFGNQYSPEEVVSGKNKYRGDQNSIFSGLPIPGEAENVRTALKFSEYEDHPSISTNQEKLKRNKEITYVSNNNDLNNFMTATTSDQPEIITTPAVQEPHFLKTLINPDVYIRTKKEKGLLYDPRKSGGDRIRCSSSYFTQKKNMVACPEALGENLKPEQYDETGLPDPGNPYGMSIMGGAQYLAMVSRQWASKNYMNPGKKKPLTDGQYLEILPYQSGHDLYQFGKSFKNDVACLDSDIINFLDNELQIRPTKNQAMIVNKLIENPDKNATIFTPFGDGKTMAIFLTFIQRFRMNQDFLPVEANYDDQELTVHQTENQKKYDKVDKISPKFLFITNGPMQSNSVAMQFYDKFGGSELEQMPKLLNLDYSKNYELWGWNFILFYSIFSYHT